MKGMEKMNNKIILKTLSGALLCTMFAYTVPVLAYTKDETVYSKLDSNGSVYNTIVNSHIKNEEQIKLINDISDLLNIQNVNGDEEFTQNENSLVWNSYGNDIYYQGESQKELPIECTVKYELNGEEITAKELAGQSGKVKITIEYINKDEHTVSINGKNVKLYTPFVAVCGTIIDNSNNKNIEITNGKLIDDGTKTIVIGMSLPGLEESLNISEDKLEIPNKVEITMDSTDFELNNIVTYVTPKVIEDSDLDLFDELDEIYSKVNTLQSSSEQLEEGANTLKEGTSTYTEKSQEFNSAMKQVSAGLSNASASYSKIDTGISTLNKNSSVLESGAKTISDGTEAVSTNLKVVSENLGKLQTGTQKLQAGEKQLETGLDQIISGVSNISATDNTEKIKELEKLVATNESTIITLKNTNTTLTEQSKLETIDENTKESLQAQITANISLIGLLEKNNEATNASIATLKTTDTTSITTLKNGLEEVKQGILGLEDGTKTLYDNQGALKTGVETLAGKTDELVEGTKTLYEGTVQISEGTKQLNSGSTQMKNGLNTLDTSTEKLTQANDQLTEGANTISEGATSLADGISKFNKEGIQTICTYINSDLKDMQLRIEKLQELAEQYNNFTMLNDGNNGNVKFIMIMDGIKKDDADRQEFIVEDKNKEQEK
jgi:putative membrane protein